MIEDKTLDELVHKFQGLFIPSEKIKANLKRTISEHPAREISGIFTPTELAELISFVKICQEKSLAIHVVSSGKNWGQGSFLPVSSPSILINLKQLNSIIDCNDNLNYVIIEPGVSQIQLSDFLIQSGSLLKTAVTGSSKDSSVVGNLLDRGVVSFSHRNKSIIAMEILLPNGDLIKTGFWSELDTKSQNAFHYSAAYGPDIKGLFTQSNLGIVTKLALRLPKKIEGSLFFIDFKEVDFKTVTTQLKWAIEHKVIEEGLLITNKNDPRTTVDNTFTYNGNWFVCGSIVGPSELIKTKKKILQDQLNEQIEFLGSKAEGAQEHPYFGVLVQMFNGIPTNFALETMAGINGTKLSNTNIDENTSMFGFSVALPAIPFHADSMLEVIQIVNTVSDQFDVHPYHNFASIEEMTFEGFYRIYFDRNNLKSVQTAHKWNKEVHLQLAEKGYFPYRINIDRMEDFFKNNNSQFEFIKKVKNITDPNRILSAKRYNLV